jgi:hypothetical protein
VAISEKGCYILRLLVLTIVAAVVLVVAFQYEDSLMILLALANILIGLAGIGFVVMDYL